MPQINTDNENAFPSINSREHSISSHHYEKSFDLFITSPKEPKNIGGPFSPGNPTVKK